VTARPVGPRIRPDTGSDQVIRGLAGQAPARPSRNGGWSSAVSARIGSLTLVSLRLLHPVSTWAAPGPHMWGLTSGCTVVLSALRGGER